MLGVGCWALDVVCLVYDDPNPATLPHRLERTILHRSARRDQPASRHIHLNRNRAHARSREPQLHRLLALWPAATTAGWSNDRDLLHRHRCGRGRGWSRPRHRHLSPLSQHQCRSTKSAQRMMRKKRETPNAQRPTRNAQLSAYVPNVLQFESVNQWITLLQSAKIGIKALLVVPDLDVGRWTLDVERLPLRKVR
jgi:hypothetical protein